MGATLNLRAANGVPTEPVDADAMLHSFLAERDAACPGCGYNLRNLQGNRCPECGDELTLRVNLVEPKLGAFITGLVGLSAGAGFNGMMLLWVFMLSWMQGNRNREMTLAIIDSFVSLVIVG